MQMKIFITITTILIIILIIYGLSKININETFFGSGPEIFKVDETGYYDNRYLLEPIYRKIYLPTIN